MPDLGGAAVGGAQDWPEQGAGNDIATIINIISSSAPKKARQCPTKTGPDARYVGLQLDIDNIQKLIPANYIQGNLTEHGGCNTGRDVTGRCTQDEEKDLAEAKTDQEMQDSQGQRHGHQPVVSLSGQAGEVIRPSGQDGESATAAAGRADGADNLSHEQQLVICPSGQAGEGDQDPASAADRADIHQPFPEKLEEVHRTGQSKERAETLPPTSTSAPAASSNIKSGKRCRLAKTCVMITTQ